MNKKWIFALSGLAFFAVQNFSTASAQRASKFKAGDFLQYCKNAKSASVCYAYVNGIADSVALSKIYAGNEGDANAPVAFCIAPAVSGKEMTTKVVAWLNNHPNTLSQPVGQMIFTALHASYPCNSKQGMESR